MDMGVGVEVGGVCGPNFVPLSPLPVREVEQTLLLPGCVLYEVGSGCPPPVCQISPGIPPDGGCCLWAASQILIGVPPYGVIFALVGPYLESPGDSSPDQLADTHIRCPPCALAVNKNFQGFPPMVEVVRMGSSP